jgi:hypothetical protein
MFDFLTAVLMVCQSSAYTLMQPEQGYSTLFQNIVTCMPILHGVYIPEDWGVV